MAQRAQVRTVVCAAVLVALVAPPGAAWASTPRPVGPRGAGSATVTLKASRTSAIAGEAVKLRGKVPASGRRPVVLQRRAGGSWTKVAKARTKATGRFTFITTTLPATTKYRVAARAFGTRPAVVTPKVKVSTVPQHADLTLATSAQVGQVRTATASFGPARTGRPVSLQLSQGGSWTTVDTGGESGDGKALFDVVPDHAGSFSYRAVAGPFHGAAPAVSPARTIVVTGGGGGGLVGPVTGAHVIATTTTSVDLAWTDPADLDLAGVMVRRQPGSTPPPSASSGAFVADVPPGAGTVSDGGLAPGTTYAYALFAHDATPAYAAAASVVATTVSIDTTPPGPVTGLSVTGTTPGSITLSWTNPAAADLAGVMIRRLPGAVPPASPSAGSLVVDAASPTTGTTDGQVVPGTQYSYAAFAHDGVPNYSSGATASGTTGPATTADWPMGQHDPEHRGWSPAEATITAGNLATTFGQEWTAPGGGSPAVVGTTLYTVGPDQLGHEGVLTAYSLASGDQAWQISTQLCQTGPIEVTATLVIVGCGEHPRAYDRTTHLLVWDTRDTDPSGSVQRESVLGTTMLAWSNTAVTAYRLSDGQKLWSQLPPAGATTLLDVAASGSTVVVAYDDRLRALSLANGSQVWSRTGVLAGQMVIADGWVYTNTSGGVTRYALANGTDGWTAPGQHDIVALEAADEDTVYAWEALYDFGPPDPSILHALAASNGAQRWQVDVPSRIRSVSITGQVVWVTTSEIYSQGREAHLLAYDRSSGALLRNVTFGDNIYGADIALGDGKVVLDQGGSFGGPDPRRLRVYGLAGAKPDITTGVLPLGRTGTPYSAQLEAVGAPGPITWSLASGSLPTGLSLGAGGAITGTPSVAGTVRATVRATAGNARTTVRSLAVSVLATSSPTWSTSGRTAARNPFEPGVPEVDVTTAPTFGFRWKTAPPGTTVSGYDLDPIVEGTRMYVVMWDGKLDAYDTTGNGANRAPQWSTGADSGVGTTTFNGGITMVGGTILVQDAERRIYGVRATDGVRLWHTDQITSDTFEAPLVVGTTMVVHSIGDGLKAYSATDGTPLWGGAETTFANGVDSRLSSDGTRVFLISECELYAVNLANGAIAWHTPVRADPAQVLAQGCATSFAYTPPPVVVGTRVHATDLTGSIVADASSGTAVLRFGGQFGSTSVVVGDLWIQQDNDRLVAVDDVTGRLAWVSQQQFSGVAIRLAASGDLVIVNAGGVFGIDRLTGATVWSEPAFNSATSAPAIGPNRIYAAREDGVHAFGPL